VGQCRGPWMAPRARRLRRASRPSSLRARFPAMAGAGERRKGPPKRAEVQEAGRKSRPSGAEREGVAQAEGQEEKEEEEEEERRTRRCLARSSQRAAASGRALARGRPRLCRPAPAAAAALHGASLLAARALEAPANHSHEGGRRGPAEVARRNLRRQLVPASHPMRLAEQS
ncbi:unnamed protein product, partial [Prorocentrum cordatum]